MYFKKDMNQFFLGKKNQIPTSILDVDAQMDLFCTIFTKNVQMLMNVLGKVKMITMLVEVPNVRIPLVPSHVCVPMGIPLTGIWQFVSNLLQVRVLEYQVDTSACSRDSRPRDWSCLGSIFLVSVSPIISRDSRD